MTAPVLVLESVEKRFGDIAVLRGVTASVERGTITAFIGPNGAGKTTLFHAISGDIRPDAGAVIYGGRSVAGLPPWRIASLGLGKMFQDVRVFRELTIVENVLVALHDHAGRSLLASLFQWPLWAKLRREEQARAEHWLDMAGVERPWDRPAAALSFGNQKLLALARLLAGGFDLFLLDEPTAGVAPGMVAQIEKLLRNLVHDRGISVAVIEHNFSFVSSVADQVYLLRAGEVFDSGPAAEVLGRGANREILIGL